MSVIFLKPTSGEAVPSATTLPASQAAVEPWSPFVDCILTAAAGCIELRAIKPAGGSADAALRTRDPDAIANFCIKHNGTDHVYVGAATRTETGGTKEHCREAIWAWVDIDFKDFVGGELEARERLAKFQYPPSIIINTGGGLHCYWVLAAKVELQKSAKPFEQALRRIAHYLGADASRTELASMMRMPGTRNMKPERDGHMTAVEKMDLSLKYDLGAFLALLQSPGGDHGSLDAIASGIVKGNRDAGALAYVNAVIKRKGPGTDDKKLLSEVTELLLKAGGDGVEVIVAKIPGWIASAHALFDAGVKPTPLVLADAIKASYGGRIVCVAGQLRIYRDGYWPLADEQVLRNQIAELSRPYTRPNLTTQALQNLKDLTVRPDFTTRTDLICLTSSTLDPETGSQLKHDPAHCLVNHLNAAWDAGAECELWTKTLAEIFAGDPDAVGKTLLLQQWFGYCLVPDTRYHKFLWLVGAGANGKSLVLQVLEAVVGVHNCTHLMLNRLGRDFVRASLRDKLINIASEMRAEDTVSDSLLKAISAGDMIEAEIKYGPSISFRPTARLVGATNELPRLLDLSEGFRRRVLIIRFPRVFAEHEQDRQRVQNLLLELPGILRWGVEGLKLLRQHGAFVVPGSSAAAVDEYLRDADPVRQFVEEDLVSDPEGSLTPKALYTRYEPWAKERGFKTMNIVTFGKRLTALGLKHRLTNGKKVWCVEFNASSNASYLTGASKVEQVGEVEMYSNHL